jgi:DNA polymerase-1
MPSRDEEIAPIIRGCFLPEEGAHWLAADYRGQEPRLTCHFAYKSKKMAAAYGINMGAIEDLVAFYQNNPDADQHQFTANLMGVPRPKAKMLNLSLTYRMQYKELARRMGVPESEGFATWNLYHNSVPWIRKLAEFAERLGQDRGYITMIDGARRHFPLWQPKWKKEEGFARLGQAKEKWPGQRLIRAYAYQAGNSLIQGSGARQTKRAMVNMFRAGHLPLIQVHDELGTNVTGPKQCEHIREIMVNAIKLSIPVEVDLEVGHTWGKAKTAYGKFYNALLYQQKCQNTTTA